MAISLRRGITFPSPPLGEAGRGPSPPLGGSWRGGYYQLPHQVRDRPEQEHDARRREQRAHRVHHTGDIRRIAHELREQVRRQHEERCTRRVTDLKLVARRYKLRTVPERGCRLNRAAIDHSGNDESQPTNGIVNNAELFHLLFSCDCRTKAYDYAKVQRKRRTTIPFLYF